MRLGRYRLIEPLGRGGQGEVWRALQVEPIVEEVALKLLTAEHAEKPGLRSQFHREAMWGARLVSPWLLPTYEFGWRRVPLPGAAAGRWRFARRVDRPPPAGAGTACPRPVRHWLLRLPRPTYVRAIVTIVARVARRLAVAHAAHRGPSRHQAGEHPGGPGAPSGVYLCDFGLGRDLDDSSPAPLCDSTGTPLYMAPERLLGHCSRRDPLRRLRAGRHPLGGRHAGGSFLVSRDQPRCTWPKYLAYSTPRLPARGCSLAADGPAVDHPPRHEPLPPKAIPEHDGPGGGPGTVAPSAPVALV